MNAVILAGGDRPEMKPLGCDNALSMLKICGVPLLETAVKNLERYGFTDIIITADRYSERIAEYFDDGRELLPKLSVTPSGTESSAAVSKAVREYDIPDDEPVIITKGDVLADIDYREALSFHRSKGADITVVVTHSDCPERSVGAAADNGLLKEIIPYPPAESCETELAVTGTVILRGELAKRLESFGGDYILNGVTALLKEGLKAAAYEEKGYFMPLEEPSDAIKACRDVMDGKYPYCPDGVLRSDSGSLKGVNAEFPFYMGENTVLSEGVSVSAYTCAGDNIFIGRNASLRECYIGDGCYIGDSAYISGAVIGDGVRVSSEAEIREEAVIGNGAVIGANAVAEQGARVWNGRRIEPYAVIKENVRFGSPRRLVLDDDGIAGEANIAVTPQTAVMAGSACASLGKRIVLGYKGDNSAFAMAMAFSSGASAAGSEVWLLGEVTEPELAGCVRICGGSAGCFIDAGVSVKIKFFSSDGLPVSRKEERLIESGLNGGACRKASPSAFGAIRHSGGIRDIYLSRLLKKRPPFLNGVKVIINTPSGRTAELCGRLLDGINDHNGSPVVFHISGDGTKISAYTDETGYVPQEKLVLIGCLAEFAEKRDVSLPFSFTQAADVLAEKYGCSVLRYMHCSNGSDREARKLAAENGFMSDGIKLMLKVVGFLSRNGISLKEACALLPDFATVSRYIAVDSPRARSMELLRKLDGGKAAGGDGIVINSGRGRVIVRPVKTGRGIMMFTESFDLEAASELCDAFQEKIKAVDC
ncbi:MAG: NTP transferase domain-containing protein [Oscillospiraceae bacterium]|nr:NTP transferase domain-containing protein [Oscillospiraceae bacterium]